MEFQRDVRRQLWFLSGPVGAVPTLPIVSVVGDRSFVRELETTRVVAGFNGDLPFMNSEA